MIIGLARIVCVTFIFVRDMGGLCPVLSFALVT